MCCGFRRIEPCKSALRTTAGKRGVCRRLSFCSVYLMLNSESKFSVVLAKARTHNHRPEFDEERRYRQPACYINHAVWVLAFAWTTARGFSPAALRALAVGPHRCYIGPARLHRASGADISPGPYRSFRELSLAGSVDPDIWCPPTFVGNSGIACFNGVCGFALWFSALLFPVITPRR